MCILIYSISQYLLRICYVVAIVLGLGIYFHVTIAKCTHR